MLADSQLSRDGWQARPTFGIGRRAASPRHPQLPVQDAESNSNVTRIVHVILLLVEVAEAWGKLSKRTTRLQARSPSISVALRCPLSLLPCLSFVGHCKMRVRAETAYRGLSDRFLRVKQSVIAFVCDAIMFMNVTLPRMKERPGDALCEQEQISVGKRDLWLMRAA